MTTITPLLQGAAAVLGFVLMLGLGTVPMASLALPRVSPTADLEGSWVGTLEAGGMQLRIVFHLTREADGALGATLDSPDQGATGIPVDDVSVQGDVLRMEVRVIGGVYEGKIESEEKSIDGTWAQGGRSFPLLLTRTDETPVVQRPQEPSAPYPYEVEEVTFENEADGVTLAGTLTKPGEGGPFPAVVLISGSGPQDRDEALMGHRPFLVLADYLTRRGLAVLRFDDRGVGASTGAFGTATSEDFARDVQAGVDYLQTRSEVDPAHIGLIGHSEGGLIAPMVAARSAEVGFIVLLAGPGLTGEEILYLQSALIARAGGTDEEAIAQNLALQRRLFDVLKQEPDPGAAAPRLLAIIKDALDGLSEEARRALGLSGDEDAALQAQVQQINAPWFRYFLTYDPAPVLRTVQCPVLAINGEKDLQVPPAENLAAIGAALREGGNEAVTIEELPGLNHLFQTASTGAPAEYAQIEETFAPTALARIGDWILSQTQRK